MNESGRRGPTSGFLVRAEAGAVGGVVGGIAVALLFFIQGAVHLHPFAVPVDLASGLFHGSDSSASSISQVSVDAVLGVQLAAYTFVHLLVFAAVGIGAMFVVDGARFWPSVFGGAAYAGVACTALLYAVRFAAGTPVALNVVGLPRVLVANALAGAIIGVALYTAEHGEERTPAP